MPYPITVLTEEQSLYWLFYRLFSYPTVWACLAVGLCAALLPDLCFKVIQGLGQQVKKAREENFKRKLLYFRDLPDNHEQQRRKRMGKFQNRSVSLTCGLIKVLILILFLDLILKKENQSSIRLKKQTQRS